MIEIVADGNSRGQAEVFPDERNKINNRPIIVPNEFTMFFNFARPSFWGNPPAIAAISGVHKPETCRYSNHFLILRITLYTNVAKAEGLQSQGVKGEVVVVYLESLTTQVLKSSGFPAR